MTGYVSLIVIAAIIYYFYKKKDSAAESATDAAVSSGNEGSGGSLTSIVNEVGRSIMNGKYDKGLDLINANIGQYQGTEKAQLLNQRAALYSIKGDHATALPDYKEAYELDDNLTNLTNYVEAMVKLNRSVEAKPLAEQGLKNPNLDKDGRKLLESVVNG